MKRNKLSKDLARHGVKHIIKSKKILINSATDDFELEGKDFGMAYWDTPPNTYFTFYVDIKDIGKRGKRIKKHQYSMWIHPQNQKSRTAWGATIKSKLKPNMTYKQALNVIQGFEKEIKEDDPKAQLNLYTDTLKAVDKSIPDPSWATKFKDQKKGNLTIRFKKPKIHFYGDKEQEQADKGRMIHNMEVPWQYAKKVNILMSELLKAQSLAGVKKILEDNKVKVKTNMYMDPMFQ